MISGPCAYMAEPLLQPPGMNFYSFPPLCYDPLLCSTSTMAGFKLKKLESLCSLNGSTLPSLPNSGSLLEFTEYPLLYPNSFLVLWAPAVC